MPDGPFSEQRWDRVKPAAVIVGVLLVEVVSAARTLGRLLGRICGRRRLQTRQNWPSLRGESQRPVKTVSARQCVLCKLWSFTIRHHRPGSAMKPGEGEQLGDVLQSVDNRLHLLRRHLPGMRLAELAGCPACSPLEPRSLRWQHLSVAWSRRL